MDNTKALEFATYNATEGNIIKCVTPENGDSILNLSKAYLDLRAQLAEWKDNYDTVETKRQILTSQLADMQEELGQFKQAADNDSIYTQKLTAELAAERAANDGLKADVGLLRQQLAIALGHVTTRQPQTKEQR